MRRYSTDAVRRILLPALLLIALSVWLWTSAVLPGPSPVPPATSVFSSSQIHRAQDYRNLGYAITLGALAAQLLAAWLLALWARPLAARMPAMLAAAAGAFAISAAALPFDFWAHRRAVDVGLDLQSNAGWARDALLACAVQAVAVAVVYGLGRIAYRRFGPAGVAVAAWIAVAVFTLLQPVLIDPLFMSTRPLPAAAAAQAAALERTMGAHPASIRVADASSRTTGENAEVDGLGPTVRVVVDDTALHAPPAQLRALLAHELGHVQRMHTLKGVLWFGVIGVPAILLVLAAASRLCRGRLLEASSVPVILACALTAAIAVAAGREPDLTPDRGRGRLGGPAGHARPGRDGGAAAAAGHHQPLQPGAAAVGGVGAVRPSPGDGPDRGRPRLLLAVLFLGAVVVVALAVELGQVLDALAGLPLGVVVLHRLDQLLHEAR